MCLTCYKSSLPPPPCVFKPTSPSLLCQTAVYKHPECSFCVACLFLCYCVLEYSCLDFGLDSVLRFGLVCWFWVELIELVWCQSTLDSCLTQSFTQLPPLLVSFSIFYTLTTTIKMYLCTTYTKIGICAHCRK